jgi:hypothetical protein
VLILAVNVVASKYKRFKRAVSISDSITRRMAGIFHIYTLHEYVITGIDEGTNLCFFRKSNPPDNDPKNLCYNAAQYMHN